MAIWLQYFLCAICRLIVHLFPHSIRISYAHTDKTKQIDGVKDFDRQIAIKIVYYIYICHN